LSSTEQIKSSESGAQDVSALFALFNEINIIAQLSSALLNRRLPDGLHSSHFGILNHLSKRDFDETPAMLADAFQVTKGTMTHSLAVLERRGLIRLRPNPDDGRSKIVDITQAGRDFVIEGRAALAPVIAAFSQLGDMQRYEKLLPDLVALRELLDNNRDL
jgi:DNA-binding MarR family transcriptional regulator